MRLHKRLSTVISSLSEKKRLSLSDTIKSPTRSFNNLLWKPLRRQDKVRWTQYCDGGASYQGQPCPPKDCFQGQLTRNVGVSISLLSFIPSAETFFCYIRFVSNKGFISCNSYKFQQFYFWQITVGKCKQLADIVTPWCLNILKVLYLKKTYIYIQ